MEYRQLGQSDLKASALALGGWVNFREENEAAAVATVRLAVEQGINYIDLANLYGYGEAERVFGRMLPGLDRDKLIISSKCYFSMDGNPNNNSLSEEHITQSVEDSLQRIGTDYLDIYYCHREDPSTPIEETVRAMGNLIAQGKIRYWGTCGWSASSIDAVCQLDTVSPIVEQSVCNMLARSAEDNLFSTIERLGMGFAAYSPLHSGILTGKYLDGVPVRSRRARAPGECYGFNDEGRAYVREHCKEAETRGVTPSQLAIAWVLKHQQVSTVILGASNVDQLEENLGALNV